MPPTTVLSSLTKSHTLLVPTLMYLEIINYPIPMSNPESHPHSFTQFSLPHPLSNSTQTLSLSAQLSSFLNSIQIQSPFSNHSPIFRNFHTILLLAYLLWPLTLRLGVRVLLLPTATFSDDEGLTMDSRNCVSILTRV